MQLNKGNTKKQSKENTDIKVHLTEEDINLVESGHMLKDIHIDAANEMLRKQFPDTKGPPFVQMLNVGGNHWITVIAVDESTITVFDSKRAGFWSRCYICTDALYRGRMFYSRDLLLGALVREAATQVTSFLGS